MRKELTESRGQLALFNAKLTKIEEDGAQTKEWMAAAPARRRAALDAINGDQSEAERRFLQRIGASIAGAQLPEAPFSIGAAPPRPASATTRAQPASTTSYTATTAASRAKVDAPDPAVDA